METYADDRDKVSCDDIRIEIKEEGTFSLKKGENVLSVLIEQGLFGISHCGGRGTCGKCRVCFEKGAPLPLPADRKFFTPDELRAGWRLACKAKPQTDCVITLQKNKSEMFILEQALFLQSEDNETVNGADTVVLLDLGTTTIVGLLADKNSAGIIRTKKQLNPQRKYGADVVSRMEAALSGKSKELSDAVNMVAKDMLLCWKEEGFLPEKVILAGNTVMTHLFLRQDISGLASAPFTPVTTVSLPFECAGIQGITLPALSAFVGGDIVAGMLVCEKQMRAEGVSHALFIDLGTNGEMVLFTPHGNLATATAAGPAFEGGFGSVLYGADVIALTAKLLRQGILDETGLLKPPYFENGYDEDGCSIRQEDIRTLQTAKAAVYAGIRILMEEAGVLPENIDRVYLAGGFGYKLSGDAACEIGLIPALFRDKTMSLGNTALAGAYLYGCHERSQTTAQKLKDETRSINLAESEKFNEYYLQAMNLREGRDFS